MRLNVLSAALKSGKFSGMSALSTPTRVTSGKWRPFVTIWVPTRMSICFFPKAVSIFACGGPLFHAVSVHAHDNGPGELVPQHLFNLLGAEARVGHSLVPALGACLRHERGVAAVVAPQPLVVLVVGERDVAVFALEDVAAVFAVHEGRVASPVEEEDHLLPLFQAACDRLEREGWRCTSPPSPSAGPAM